MTKPRSALSVLEAIWYKNYSIVSPDNFWLSDHLNDEFGFESREYKSRSELNHWKIPEEVVPTLAVIKNARGDVLFDATELPLALPPLCPAVEARLTRQELEDRLVTVPDIPDARMYAWWNLYRTTPDWVFSVTQDEKHRILNADESFSVEIKTDVRDSRMVVNSRLHKGKKKETIIVTAHTCHPYQANDDMSGVAASVWFSEWLKTRDTQFSYLVLLAPELLGPMFWLDELESEFRKNLVGCIQLKSIANDHEMRLQKSFPGDTFLDFFAEKILPIKNDHTIRKYRECYGNDETVFEALPYQIPSITFTRMPTDVGIPQFKGYHTSADNLENLDESMLVNSCEMLVELVSKIENSSFPKLLCKGVPRLGDLGLYCPLPPGSLDSGIDYESHEMRKHTFMNCVANLADGKICTEQMAARYGLSHDYVLEYLKGWEKAGLLKFT